MTPETVIGFFHEYVAFLRARGMKPEVDPRSLWVHWIERHNTIGLISDETFKDLWVITPELRPIPDQE